MSEQRTIDPETLFSIDVDAEIRKLSQAQFQGAFQLPAELVRRAIRLGADRVTVRFERHGVVVSSNATALAHGDLEALAVLVDGSKARPLRHQALTRLEQLREAPLLALAGLDGATIEVAATSNGQLRTLRIGKDGRPTLTQDTSTKGDGDSIGLRTPALDHPAARNWLVKVCRFAPVAIMVDGAAIERPLPPCMARQRFDGTFPFEILIPESGDSAHISLLEWGVVTSRLGVPGAPCFEAAVELGQTGAYLNSARLRSYIEPHLDTVVDSALAVLRDLGNADTPLATHRRTRLAHLVLTGLKHSPKRRDLEQIRLFRVLDAHGHKVRLESVEGLRLLCGDGQSLSAITPDQDPRRFIHLGDTTAILDGVERSHLTALLPIQITAPQRRSGGWSIYRGFARAIELVGEGFQRLAHPLHRPPVDDDGLRPEERLLLDQLRKQAHRFSAGPVNMCEGAGPIRRREDSFLLPRKNRDVVLCVAALQRDSQSVYPASLLLFHRRPAPRRDRPGSRQPRP